MSLCVTQIQNKEMVPFLKTCNFNIHRQQTLKRQQKMLICLRGSRPSISPGPACGEGGRRKRGLQRKKAHMTSGLHSRAAERLCGQSEMAKSPVQGEDLRGDVLASHQQHKVTFVISVAKSVALAETKDFNAGRKSVKQPARAQVHPRQSVSSLRSRKLDYR